MVDAVSAVTSGDELYAGWPSIGLEHAGADPAGRVLSMTDATWVDRDVELDVTVPVQAAGLIGLDLARRPVLTVPGLPGERRVVRVHADALDVAGEFEPQNARGHRHR